MRKSILLSRVWKQVCDHHVLLSERATKLVVSGEGVSFAL